MDNAVKKKIIVASVIVAIILLAVAVFFLVWKGLPSPTPVEKNNNKTTQAGDSMKDNLGTDAAQETQKLIDEVKSISDDIKNGKTEDNQKISQVVTFTRTEANGTTTSETTEQAVVVAPESNPISVTSGDVLTRDGGKEADNDLQAGDVNAPLQSDPVDPTKLPESAVKIVMSPTAVTPKEFKVKPKQAVALSVTSESSVEIFKFDDESLSAVAVGLKPGETRVITFNAPAKPGIYKFYSDFAGHRSTGAEGIMIVE
jgi:hypothetical protein